VLRVIAERVADLVERQPELLERVGQGAMPVMNYNSDIKHDGSGSINNSETVVAKIAVRIVDVLPNRNLVVEGRRDSACGCDREAAG